MRPAAAGLLALLLAACSGDAGDDLELAHDLAALLPAAEVVAEPRAIAFASPEDRHHLRSGWSRLERDPRRGRGFAWGLGPASTLDIHLFEARDLDLWLEGRPFKAPGLAPQAVTVAVNGTVAGELELRSRLDVYSLRLPVELLRAGANRLQLGYRWSRSPRQVSDAEDRRMLAVAWYGIGFGGAGSSRSTTGVPLRSIADGEPSKLFVPAGSEVAYYLEVAPRSRLRLGWSWLDSAPERLEIVFEAEGGEAETLVTLEGNVGRAWVPVGTDRRQLARLALRALPPEGEAPKGGVELSAPAVWSPRAPEPATPAAESVGSQVPPNIVLYLIDTLRADRLGCYGPPGGGQTERSPGGGQTERSPGGGQTERSPEGGQTERSPAGRPTERPEPSASPRIDAFAQDAVLFERAVAQSSWTRASMASVFTGRWPPAHGTNGRDDRLRGDLEVLPERLRAAGYRTAAFVTNPNLGAVFGFDRGFDDFVELPQDIGSDGVHRAVTEWLDTRADQGPFFLWVHTVDPHAPYIAPEPFAGRLAPGVDAEVGRRSLALLDALQAGRQTLDAGLLGQLEALYDAAVAYNDHSFGTLLDTLDGRGLLDGAALILLSDHGEEFHEHGNWQHGRALHVESIRVPLIVKLPAAGGRVPGAGRRVAQRVQHVDLLPTLLDLSGLPPAPEVEGRSLLPLIAGAAPAPPVPAFSFLHLDGPARVSVAAGGWKLIQRLEHGRLTRSRLYHLAEDPGETEELSGRYPIRTGHLASLIRAKLAGRRLEAEVAEIDERTRKALEALGYL